MGVKPYYQDASVTIYHGDALAIMDDLPEGSADHVIVDPPYSSGTRREGAKGLRKSMTRTQDDEKWFANDSMTTNGFLWLMRSCAYEWNRILPKGAHILSFIDWRMMPALGGAIESADLRSANLCVWDKMMFGMGACFRNQHELILHFTKGVGREPSRRDMPNVLRFPAIRGGDHDTEKPVELLSALTSTVTLPGETILDCFMGSGTALRAAKDLGRKAIGIELEERYREIAAERMKQEVLAITEHPETITPGLGL